MYRTGAKPTIEEFGLFEFGGRTLLYARLQYVDSFHIIENIGTAMTKV